MTPQVLFKDLGLVGYKEAWDAQTLKHQAIIAQKLAHRGEAPGSFPQEHVFWVLEHPHVYTLGKSGSMDHLLLSETEMTARGISFFPINRGGDITYHGPGQIVGYPILDLECFFTDVHRYVRAVEEVIIRTLADYGVEGYRIKDYTGVWVGFPPDKAVAEGTDMVHRKVCAIGVHLSRWVTLHGFAFNVNTDLQYFDYIVPCGIAETDKTVSSLAAELGREIPLDEVKSKLRHHFGVVFEAEMM